MIRLTIVSRAAGHQSQHADALEQGCRRLGITAIRKAPNATVETEIVACWGWRIGSIYAALGHDVLVMERGYIGDRFSWTSLAWNGLNGWGTFPSIEDGGKRFQEQHGHLLKPWRTSGGDYVLLIGQVPGDAALAGRDLYPWYCQQAGHWAQRTGLPVLLRPHPLAIRRAPVRAVPFTKTNTGDLGQALAGAAAVVTYSSNTAVESVLAGVPTVATDGGSMAYAVTSHTPNQDLVRPDRTTWAHDLACRQWRIGEIASGDALRPLFELRAAGALKRPMVKRG